MDEAGRGPLAGPVCAAAVTLPRDLVIPGLDDSKKLTEKRREALFDAVRGCARFVGVGVATAREIDELNILQATRLAMARAAQSCSARAGFSALLGHTGRERGRLYEGQHAFSGAGGQLSVLHRQ